ncbi:YdbH domain-containing protein, partial [Pseudomonas aeruginosa]|nr:YdbH domain-containing protein [Pseudomonas aeruginosa]
HGEWLQALPAELRPSALGLRSEPLERDADSVTALRLAFTSEGASTLKLETRLDLLGISPWAARLVEGRLQVDAPRLQYLGWKAERLVAEIPLEGRLDGQRANLSFGRGARLQAASLAEPSTLHLGQPRLDLAGAALELAYQPLALHFAGPLQAQVGQLRQANLKPLAWTFEGPLDTTLERTSLKGRLSNGAGLAADIQLQRDAKTPLALSARLAEVFFRTGNPLAATLADWPGLLELGNGRATAAAGWKLDAAGASSLDLDLTLKGLDGIYDRSELKGLGGSLALRLRGGQLSLDSPGLSLAEANPGLPLGPVSFRGRYEAPLSAPGSGRLSWQTLQSGLFGGQASVPAGSIRLGQAEQKFALRIQGIQLGEIFRVYPAEGLAGEGALDGELPLMLNRWKPSVSGGQVKAREPGYLRFRSAKIEALGRSNPGMKLVADALDDFHYDVLQSSVDYHENGKLLLGLRLQGSNPDLEKGRPVNLNVNLEEDIPALLTSLQLSDRVSETIRQRVQERMQKRKASAP